MHLYSVKYSYFFHLFSLQCIAYVRLRRVIHITAADCGYHTPTPQLRSSHKHVHSHIIKSSLSTSCLERFLLNVHIQSLRLQCELDVVFFTEASSLSSSFFRCSSSLILLSCLDQQHMSSEDQMADSDTSPSHSLHLCCLHHRNHRRAYT